MSASATINSFLAHWRIGTGAPGAVTLDLKTVVSTPTHHVQGAGDVTQAVNPPIHIHTTVRGTYSALGTAVVISLTGTPQMGPIMEDFQGHIYLPNGWNQEGVASYRFQANGAWHDVENVKAVPLHADQTMAAGTGGTGRRS